MDSVLNIIELRGMIPRLATYGHRGIGRAMVGVDPGNNMFLVLFAAAVLIEMNQPISGIYSCGATAGQGHMIEIARGQFGQFGSQSSRGNIGHIHKGAGIGHFAHLLSNGIGHFFAAQANISAPEAAHSIQVAIAIAIINIGALGCSYRQSPLFCNGIKDLPGMQKMRPVSLRDSCGVVLGEIGWLGAKRHRNLSWHS